MFYSDCFFMMNHWRKYYLFGINREYKVFPLFVIFVCVQPHHEILVKVLDYPLSKIISLIQQRNLQQLL